MGIHAGCFVTIFNKRFLCLRWFMFYEMMCQCDESLKFMWDISMKYIISCRHKLHNDTYFYPFRDIKFSVVYLIEMFCCYVQVCYAHVMICPGCFVHFSVSKGHNC